MNRQDGQGTSSDLKNRDFRKELEEKERSGREKGGRGDRRGGKWDGRDIIYHIYLGGWFQSVYVP